MWRRLRLDRGELEAAWRAAAERRQPWLTRRELEHGDTFANLLRAFANLLRAFANLLRAFANLRRTFSNRRRAVANRLRAFANRPCTFFRLGVRHCECRVDRFVSGRIVPMRRLYEPPRRPRASINK